MQSAAQEHRQWIAGEVLAREVVINDVLADDSEAVAVDLDGATAFIALTKDV
jgi:hypothetical protein